MFIYYVMDGLWTLPMILEVTTREISLWDPNVQKRYRETFYFKNMKDINEFYLEKCTENEELRKSLRTILMNTINRDFGGDIMYKSCVLATIRAALGEEEYKYYEDLYT